MNETIQNIESIGFGQSKHPLGEAEAIKVRGEALKLNPAFLRLKIVERWNGKSPLVVPADPNNTGAGLLLPLGSAEKPVMP